MMPILVKVMKSKVEERPSLVTGGYDPYRCQKVTQFVSYSVGPGAFPTQVVLLWFQDFKVKKP